MKPEEFDMMIFSKNSRAVIKEKAVRIDRVDFENHTITADDGEEYFCEGIKVIGEDVSEEKEKTEIDAISAEYARSFLRGGKL